MTIVLFCQAWVPGYVSVFSLCTNLLKIYIYPILKKNFIRTSRVTSLLCPVLKECLHFLVTSCKTYWFVELKCKIYGCPSAAFVTRKSVLAIMSFLFPVLFLLVSKRSSMWCQIVRFICALLSSCPTARLPSEASTHAVPVSY